MGSDAELTLVPRLALTARSFRSRCVRWAPRDTPRGGPLQGGRTTWLHSGRPHRRFNSLARLCMCTATTATALLLLLTSTALAHPAADSTAGFGSTPSPLPPLLNLNPPPNVPDVKLLLTGDEQARDYWVASEYIAHSGKNASLDAYWDAVLLGLYAVNPRITEGQAAAQMHQYLRKWDQYQHTVGAEYRTSQENEEAIGSIITSVPSVNPSLQVGQALYGAARKIGKFLTAGDRATAEALADEVDATNTAEESGNAADTARGLGVSRVWSTVYDAGKLNPGYAHARQRILGDRNGSIIPGAPFGTIIKERPSPRTAGH